MSPKYSFTGLDVISEYFSLAQVILVDNKPLH